LPPVTLITESGWTATPVHCFVIGICSMSGGHFDYAQYRLNDIASSIDELIASNDDTSRNEYGDTRGAGHSVETIERFKEASATLRRAEAMAQRVDWLVSGDDGEESFHSRWEKEVPGGHSR